MSEDNPILEPADLMYETSRSDLEETTETDDITPPEEEPTEEEETEQVTESDVEEEAETSDSNKEDDDLEVYQLGKHEITESDLDTWKEAFDKRESMQADYTRKTTAAAVLTKEAEARQSSADELTKSLQAHIDRLEKVGLNELSAEEMEELRDTDPSEYLKKKEELENNQKVLDSARTEADKAKVQEGQAIIVVEQRKLGEAFPTWLDANGERTDQYKKDMTLMTDYLSSIGYSNDEMNQLENHKSWVIAYDAARYREIEKGSASLVKKVKKAPKAIKPTLKKKANSKQLDGKDVENLFYGT